VMSRRRMRMGRAYSFVERLFYREDGRPDKQCMTMRDST
jgi:hypothetical protein